MSMTMTAHAPALPLDRPTGLMAGVRALLMSRRAQQAALNLERQLAGMSDHQLQDIGLRRDQIGRVVNSCRLGASVSLPL